jgi:AraC-like DNA-binding protein
MDAQSGELALRAATAALALSASAALLLRRPRGEAAAWAAIVVGGIAAFAIASARGGVAALGFLPVFAFNAWCVATPAVAWVLARMLFLEGMRPGPRDLAVVGAIAVVTTAADWGRFGLGPLGDRPQDASLLLLACRGVALGLLVAACAVAVTHWRADLVESRRRVRGVFVGVVTAVFVALASSEFLFAGAGAPPPIRIAGLSLLFVLAFALLQAIARGMLDEVLAGAPSPATPALTVVASAAPASGLARRVVEEMAARELWKRERLGIAGLAAELGTQEYLLRRAINRDLGYRNFNDFLHDYRLKEAARRLADPAERLPVLSIALDCGYGSIGPFNRAFKARFGTTPTQFRAAHDAQPEAVSGIGATPR